MASIAIRTDVKGRKVYRPRYRDAAGKEHNKSFARKADAQNWLDEVTASMVSGTYVEPGRGKLTVGQWAEQWMAARSHLKPKTIASYESLLRTRVLPRWERVPLARITHSDVAAWVASMRAGGLSASRTRQSYHLLTSMLDDAVRDNRLARNPAAKVDLPRIPTTDRRYLTHEQLEDLADGCGPHRLLVLLAGYTGLRWGELTGLRVKRVDLSRARIEITESVVEVNGRMISGSPKTHERRSVSVPEFLRDDLAQHVADKGGDDLVFASAAGTPLRVGNFRRDHFDRAADAAGLKGLVPHELRHTAASLAIASGASIKGVQAMLGHASAAMTLDRYGHLMGDELDAVAKSMNKARSAKISTGRGGTAASSRR